MLWECLACTTRYSVDAPQCPHCGSTEYRVYGSDPDAPGTTTGVEDIGPVEDESGGSA